jgi:hypothetical protein
MDADRVVTVRPLADASSMAGVAARACGTSALPGLNPILHVLPPTSGVRICEPASHAEKHTNNREPEKGRGFKDVLGRGSWIRTNDLQYPKLIIAVPDSSLRLRKVVKYQ